MSMFEIKNISKSYGKNKALNQVSFSMKAGEIVALIGKNGAGKSTLLNSIAGVIYPDEGEINYNGHNLLSDYRPLKDFGILIEAVFFDYLNAMENLKLLSKAEGAFNNTTMEEEIIRILKLVGLEKNKKDYVKTFSFGMKQRLGLAQTLIGKKKILIYDEPFIGLDPIGKEILKAIIIEKAKKDKVGVLLSSHDLMDVEEICDRVIMINKGKKIYDGVFENNKLYMLMLENVLTQEEEEAIVLKFPEVVIEQGMVLVIAKSDLSEAILYLSDKKMRIIDMKIQSKTMYDLFKEEVEENEKIG